MYAVEILTRLLELAEERTAAEAAGLVANPVYMADLESELLEYRHAMVGAVVTDIAVSRGEQLGRNAG
jgi:hypothetical protein